MMLHSRLMTDLYLCGCLTSSSNELIDQSAKGMIPAARWYQRWTKRFTLLLLSLFGSHHESRAQLLAAGRDGHSHPFCRQVTEFDVNIRDQACVDLAHVGLWFGNHRNSGHLSDSLVSWRFSKWSQEHMTGTKLRVRG